MAQITTEGTFENQFEGALKDCLKDTLTSAPPRLTQAIEYSLLASGKRLRPKLAHATAQLFGLTKEKAIETALIAAIPVEMIHCFTLIHDDLPCMDNDDFRRGKPTNHKVFGEPLALLAGDALIPAAIEVYLQLSKNCTPKQQLRALKTLLAASGANGVIGGQARELDLVKNPNRTELETTHALKTAALFQAPCLMVADLLEIPLGAYEQLRQLTYSLGMSYQILDDLEDAEQDQGPRQTMSLLGYLSFAQTCERLSHLLTEAKNLSMHLIQQFNSDSTLSDLAQFRILNWITTIEERAHEVAKTKKK